MLRIQKVWLSLGLVHLFLASIGAFEIDLGPGLIGRAFQTYGRFTGANSGFGFFAPGVGSQLRATFEVEKRDGNLVITTLESGKNREADLRTGNIIGWFSKNNPDKSIRRSIAASWAGKLFGRHPDAKTVQVVIEEYHLPSMASYRSGGKPHWNSYYKGKFEKKVDSTLENGTLK